MSVKSEEYYCGYLCTYLLSLWRRVSSLAMFLANFTHSGIKGIKELSDEYMKKKKKLRKVFKKNIRKRPQNPAPVAVTGSHF